MTDQIFCIICETEATSDYIDIADNLSMYSHTILKVKDNTFIPFGHDKCLDTFKSLQNFENIKCNTCLRLISIFVDKDKIIRNPDIYIYKLSEIYCNPICFYNRESHDKETNDRTKDSKPFKG